MRCSLICSECLSVSASLTNSSFLCHLQALTRPDIGACVLFRVVSYRFRWGTSSGCPAAAVRSKEEAAHQRRTPPAVSQILPVLARIQRRGSVCEFVKKNVLFNSPGNISLTFIHIKLAEVASPPNYTLIF